MLVLDSDKQYEAEEKCQCKNNNVAAYLHIGTKQMIKGGV